MRQWSQRFADITRTAAFQPVPRLTDFKRHIFAIPRVAIRLRTHGGSTSTSSSHPGSGIRRARHRIDRLNLGPERFNNPIDAAKILDDAHIGAGQCNGNVALNSTFQLRRIIRRTKDRTALAHHFQRRQRAQRRPIGNACCNNLPIAAAEDGNPASLSQCTDCSPETPATTRHAPPRFSLSTV